MAEITDIGFLIVLVTRSHHRLASQIFNTIGLYRGSPPVLLELGRNEGINQAELAERLNLTQPTITALLTRLESSGLVIRKPNSEDGRSYLIYLTKPGKKKVEQAIKLARKTDEIMFEGFTDNELEDFHKYLTRIHQNLRIGISKTKE